MIKLGILRWEMTLGYLSKPQVLSHEHFYVRCRGRMDKEKTPWSQRQRQEGGDHKPGSAGSHQKLEEAPKDHPLGPPEGAWPC